MWITIYFKSGKIIETCINFFGELDGRYNKDDIMQIDIGCTMLDENREKQQVQIGRASCRERVCQDV